MGDLVKYAKVYAVSALIAKGAFVLAVVLPIVAMVASGGGELVIKWSVGQ